MDSRRGTLASEGSGIPMPPSAMKKVSRLGPARQSLAPSQSRMSSAQGGLGVSHSSSQEGAYGGTGFGRKSMMPGRGGDRDIGASGTRGDGGMFGRTPQTMRSMPSSVRRSSVFPSGSQGRPSMAPGSMYSAAAFKDPRPIRDKSFQASCARNVSDYLLSARNSPAITPKTLTSPTAKEFQSIVRFLVGEIDPGATWGKKFEDDTLSMLKDMRYPGMDSVSKTALTAPGAPQSWSGLLAMLNWLVELCKAHVNWEDPNIINDPVLMPASELPVDHPNFEDRLLWDFSSATYREWFDAGAEQFDDAEQALQEVFDKKARTFVEDCEKLESEIQMRDVECRQLHAQEPPLKKLEDEYVQLMGDKTKFIAFVDMHQQKAEKMRQRIAKIRSAISTQDGEMEGLKSELARIEQAVSAQNLSPDEVNRMTHERETLTRNLDELRVKIGEASQLAYDQEMMVTKSMDRFEALLVDYNSLAHQLGLMTSPEAATFVIDLDLGSEDLEEIKDVGAKMRSVIWQALQTHRETFRREALELGNRTIALENDFDKLGQKVEGQKGEAGNLEVRLKVANQQADDAQSQLLAEGKETSATIESLETAVTTMLAASQQGVLAQQSQLESTRIAFKELRHKTALLQDSVVAQVGGHIDVIIKAKEHAADSLRSIRALAETQ
ncbi:hypothetical protein IAT38_007367 [Cryptococcus sp. DSM 104549]